jgi:hypothetical protein
MTKVVIGTIKNLFIFLFFQDDYLSKVARVILHLQPGKYYFLSGVTPLVLDK